MMMVRNILIAAILLLDYGYDEVGRNPLAIKNGDPANISSYLFMVSILVNKSLLCGGTIMSRNIILTAAHCVDNVPIHTLLVNAGSSFPWIGNETRTVLDIFKPDNYTSQTFNRINDICLLLLGVGLDIINDVKSINWSGRIPVDTVTILGFGVSVSVLDARLRVAKFVFLNNTSCEQQFGFYLESQFCAGDSHGNKTLVNGDDGSPVIYHKKLIGVVSLFKSGYVVAVQIHDYKTFIEKIIEEHP